MIKIFENSGIRYYLQDNTLQSAIDLENNNKLIFKYLNEIDKIVEINQHKNILMLGGGGFIYPKYFLNKYLDSKIDVVEINPLSIIYAKEYFYLKQNNRLTIFQKDGRQFLKQIDYQYDIIINDMYIKDSTLIHVNDQDIQKCLKQKGIFIENMINNDKNKILFWRKEDNNYGYQ